MRKSKLMLSMILTGAMALSLLTGCGSQTKQTTSASNDGKVKEFSAFFAVAGKDIPNDNRVKNVIGDKIGAKINETWLTGQTAKERIGVMVAGGEYPDFIEGGEGEQQLLDAGALLPIDKYWDKYPNIKNFWPASEWEKCRKEDGHIYYMPQFGNYYGKDTRTTHNDEAFWIQKAVLEWANYPKIKTLDEYFALIEKYKAANPTINGQPSIGFEILCDDWRYFCLENPPQFLAGYPNDGKAIIDPKTITAQNYNTIPEAQQYYKKLNEEYNKGIIDSETFTAKYDQYIAKISTGAVLGMVDQQWDFENGTKSLKSQNLYERTYVPLALTLDPNVKPNYATLPAINAGSGIGVTTSCKDVEGAFKAINDLLDQDVMALRTWGEKDKDYMVGADGAFYKTEEQRAQFWDVDWTKANMCTYSYFPIYKGMFKDGINVIQVDEQPKEFYDSLKPVEKKLLDAYGYKKFTDFVNVPAEKNTAWYPIYSATGAFGSDTPAGIAMQKMDDIKRQWLPKVVMAGAGQFDASWKEYQTTLTTGADIKAYEDALTKEARRRNDLFAQK